MPEAGIHSVLDKQWIPACAGMTTRKIADGKFDPEISITPRIGNR
jgi:hypothetical protein